MKAGWAAAGLVGILSACGGGSTAPSSGAPSSTSGSINLPATGTAGTPGTPTDTPDVGAGTSPPASGSTQSSPVAMVVAYPTPPRGMFLMDLNDNSHAAGFSDYTTPLSVSAQNYHVANVENFAPTPVPTQTNAGSNNDAGVMAGSSTDAAGQTWHWRWDGATTTPVPAPTDRSLTLASVIGIDNANRVAVQLWEGSLRRVASVDAAGRYTVMPALGDANDVNGENANLVSNGGVIAGYARLGNGSTSIFTWTPGQMPRIVFTDTTGICGCSIRSVNDQGQVLIDVQTPRSAGGGTTRDPAYGLLVSPAGVTRLPLGNYHGLNNAGEIVGAISSSSDDPYPSGFWLVNGQMRDLNDYTQAASFGWRFGLAKFINNRKQIVGTGMFNGQERWYLLTLK